MTFWASDLPGFGLRVRSGGGRTWLVQLRVKSGETQRHTLGDAATVPFAKARSRAQELLAQPKLGGNPAEARKRARESIKVQELASAYLRHQQARMKPRSYDELRRHMEAHAKPLH